MFYQWCQDIYSVKMIYNSENKLNQLNCIQFSIILIAFFLYKIMAKIYAFVKCHKINKYPFPRKSYQDNNFF